MYQPRPSAHHIGDLIDAIAQRRVHQMRITLRSRHLGVPEQAANHFQRGAAADKQRGKGVAKVVDPHARDVGLALDANPEPTNFLYGLAGRVTGKQPGAALWDYKLTLAHQSGDVRRNRDAMHLDVISHIKIELPTAQLAAASTLLASLQLI